MSIKVRFREYAKALMCPHKEYEIKVVNNGFKTHNIYKCKKCEKTWVY